MTSDTPSREAGLQARGDDFYHWAAENILHSKALAPQRMKLVKPAGEYNPGNWKTAQDELCEAVDAYEGNPE